MSSTYTSKYIQVEVESCFLNRQASVGHLSQPFLFNVALKFSYQALGACLRPYKALNSLHTFVLSLTPCGQRMYTSSSRYAFVKALPTSSCDISQSIATESDIRALKEASLQVGAKVSL